MNTECRWFWAAIPLFLLVLCGCRPKEDQTAPPQQAAGPSPTEIVAARDAMTRGMVQVSLDKLDKSQMGKRCVITARTPEGGLHISPPPPPLGMVRMMGRTTLYMGELNEISPDAIKIRAAYPTSGNYKLLEIPRADIQSIHLGE